MNHDQVVENHKALLARLPEYLNDHRGEYALLRDREIAGLFATELEALEVGEQRFPDDRFSIQEITDRRIDLGFFSHAVQLRAG